jgi:mannose-1-phosphate guanylyltransferase
MKQHTAYSTQYPVTFVIMAGGQGERLWPLARRETPKVCLPLNGNGSLLQITLDRLRALWPRAEILIVTSRDQEAAVRAGLPTALQRVLLVEPRIRNTAACLTLAASVVSRRSPQRLMVVAPADHWITRHGAFRRAVEAAADSAIRHRTIATIGLVPTHAHGGFGYLCRGPLVRRCGATRVFALARFVEKPSRARLARLLHRPGTYWNSGIFTATAETFLAAIRRALPDHGRRIPPLAAGWTPGRRQAAFLRRADQAYRRVPAVSFDEGVMRGLKGGLVVEGRFDWVDVGSWEAWARVQGRPSRAIRIDAPNVTVIGRNGHLVAAVGVRDLIVVQGSNATLICRPDRTQRVREVLQLLRADPQWALYR